MNDVPHQWILDHLSALCLMGEMDKEEVDRLYALFVQRFPDEVAQLRLRLLFSENPGWISNSKGITTSRRAPSNTILSVGRTSLIVN